MANKIRGIAVYPLKKKTPEGHIIPTKCDSTKVPCGKKVTTPLEPEVDYKIVCTVKCDNEKEVNNYAIEGSIEKTFGSLIADKVLVKKTLNDKDKDIEGCYRQWWDWENKFPAWKQFGTYNVNLKLIDKKDKEKEIINEITIPVTFTKPNYDKGEYNIENQWI